LGELGGFLSYSAPTPWRGEPQQLPARPAGKFIRIHIYYLVYTCISTAIQVEAQFDRRHDRLVSRPQPARRSNRGTPPTPPTPPSFWFSRQVGETSVSPPKPPTPPSFWPGRGLGGGGMGCVAWHGNGGESAASASRCPPRRRRRAAVWSGRRRIPRALQAQRQMEPSEARARPRSRADLEKPWRHRATPFASIQTAPPVPGSSSASTPAGSRRTRCVCVASAAKKRGGDHGGGEACRRVSPAALEHAQRRGRGFRCAVQE